MHSNNIRALDKVIKYCEWIVYERKGLINKTGVETAHTAPTDDEIEVCEHILSIINKELKKKNTKK